MNNKESSGRGIREVAWGTDIGHPYKSFGFCFEEPLGGFEQMSDLCLNRNIRAPLR